MKRIHPKIKDKYRPLVGIPYKHVLLKIALELNKTSMNTFNDLSALRHAVYELWERVFPSIPFPRDADNMRMKYHKDPNV
jgi:hypothetical protein